MSKKLVPAAASVALFALTSMVCSGVSAELTSMSEDELSSVNGQGIGLVLEDFVFEHGTNLPAGRLFKIGGIKSSKGEDVEIIVDKLYIARAGSNNGQNLQPVNLGRLNNPYSIDVVNGDNIGLPGKAVLELAAPKKIAQSVGFDCLNASAAAGSGTCSSRPAFAGFENGERPDIGLQTNIKVGANAGHKLNINAKSVVVDGSYIRLYGDNNRKQLAGEIRLNFYTPELSITTCDSTAQNCGNTIMFRNFELELALGNRFQPMFLDVNGTGNLVFEIQAIRKPLPGEIGANGLKSSSNAAAWDFYNNYYTNPEFRSNLRIGELAIGNKSFGSAKVEGMLIQYLQITTHDLAP